ncbi:MAG: glycosyltransferase [Ginsengibacter sp.]
MPISLHRKIIISVISDIVTDQRVQKECNTLAKMGYEVLLIGRKSKRNFSLNDLPFKVIRFRNLFRKGPFMYVVFNAQLFFYLLFNKADVLWANDLDTLLPNYFISKAKKIKIIYDSHEYFTASVYKESSRKIWESLEKRLFPRLKNVITVNNSIKKIYENRYDVPVTVLRNVPYKHLPNNIQKKVVLPLDMKILIIQGMGINEHRGAEEAILAMQFLPNDFNLYFIGGGTILDKLKRMVDELKLTSKIIFIDPLPYEEMMDYTKQGFLGLVLEKIDVTDEHLLALPNKFFDYIHAGIPVLSSKAVEIKMIIEQYEIGDFINNFDPKYMATKIMEIAENKEEYNLWKRNTLVAAEELNWENEEKILIDFMQRLR